MVLVPKLEQLDKTLKLLQFISQITASAVDFHFQQKNIGNNMCVYTDMQLYMHANA